MSRSDAIGQGYGPRSSQHGRGREAYGHGYEGDIWQRGHAGVGSAGQEHRDFPSEGYGQSLGEGGYGGYGAYDGSQFGASRRPRDGGPPEGWQRGQMGRDSAWQYAESEHPGSDFGRRDGYDARKFGLSGHIGREERGRGPKGYTRSDERLKEEVCERLSAQHRDWSDVDVQVSNGEVILTGTVSERHMKYEAEQTADAVRGVRDVTNQLRVRRESSAANGSSSLSGAPTSQARETGDGHSARGGDARR